jgi:membrane-associated phospholipid phosphatase
MDFVGNSIDTEAYRQLYTSLGEPNSVAAVPSIHMAVTFAVFLWVRRYYRALAPIFLAYSAVMALSLMHLAEHYAFDVLVGVLCALAVDFVLERIDRRRRPTVEPALTKPRP